MQKQLLHFKLTRKGKSTIVQILDSQNEALDEKLILDINPNFLESGHSAPPLETCSLR